MRGGGMGAGWWITEWAEGCTGTTRGGGATVTGE